MFNLSLFQSKILILALLLVPAYASAEEEQPSTYMSWVSWSTTKVLRAVVAVMVWMGQAPRAPVSI